jgi:Flp pilus assembly protein TadD
MSSQPLTARDRNLLFGVLALQMNFVSRDALVEAMHAWAMDQAKPLSEILQERGALRPDVRSVLDALVDKHLDQHGGDAERSLAAALPTGPAGEELCRITGRELAGASTRATPTPPAATDPNATLTPVPPAAADINAPPTCGPAGLRYRVLRPHARGGLGRVSVALDAELGREVALKEIQERYDADPASRARFILEAEVTGRLEHPGIVPVYGLGRHADGRPYYAMRLIKGDSLHEAIRHFHRADSAGRAAGERSLALHRLLRHFVDACNAIAYAHSRGVLHRDLKPANIMLGPYGETLVVDWGLAKLVGRPDDVPAAAEAPLPAAASQTVPTQAGAAVGTPAFMSPEQAAGRLDRLGPASDVYALGATLYCLLTGQAPFTQAEPGEILRRVREGDFSPPRQTKRGVPAALEAVCLKAMALRPEDRYASARALADDVEHWLADEPVSAYREPLRVRLGRTCRRHPAPATAVALLLLAAAAGGLWLASERAAAGRDAGDTLEQARQMIADGRWADARVAVERADGRLAGGGPTSLRTAVRRARADLDLVADLEEARGRRTQVRHGRLDSGAMSAAYAAAFERYGLDPLAPDPDAVAERIAASAVGGTIVVALDDWGQVGPRAERLRLLALAHLVDDDAFRRRLRDPAVLSDRVALEKLAAQEAWKGQPAATQRLLAARLSTAGARERAVHVLRVAQQQHPDDLWINFDLADALAELKPPRMVEALGFYRAALALRPGSPAVHYDCGLVLERLGRPAEAELEFRTVLALQPDFAEGHNDLGNVLSQQGRLDEAEGELRRALALRPVFPEARCNLGVLFGKQNRLAEAEAEIRGALKLKPDFALGHYNLGDVLARAGRQGQAEAEFRQALKLQPELAEPHNELGRFLLQRGQPAAAEAEFRRAVEIKPRFLAARQNLGVALLAQNRLADAEAELRRAVELQPDAAEPHFNLGFALAARGRKAAALAEYRWALRLRPDFAEPLIKAAILLSESGRPAEALAEFRRAFAARPGLADDLRLEVRYNAACAAALAGCGKGDGARLSETERAALRRQALAWLRADLVRRAAQARSTNPEDRAQARKRLSYWQTDSDLAGVRDAAALAKRPEEERTAWRRFWDEVAAVLRKAGQKVTGQAFRPERRTAMGTKRLYLAAADVVS